MSFRRMFALLLTPAALCGQPFTTRTAFHFNFQEKDDRTENYAERQYERGRRALDKEQWQTALNHFDEVTATGKTNADAALYWKAFALTRLGRGADAVAILDTLANKYSQSRWLSLAASLKAEAAQGTPANAASDDVKVSAVNALMNTDPERAIPLLQKVLEGPATPRLHERVLAVLTRSGSPKAREIVAGIAKGAGNPDLQIVAVRQLATQGAEQNGELLNNIYASSSDAVVKKAVLQGYLVGGDRDRLITVAKSDPDLEMRKRAVELLGSMGANTQLAELYSSETSDEVRSRLLRAMFVSGNSAKLIELAQSEKDPELRRQAIQYLGNMGSADAAEALASMYQGNTETELRKRILRSLFVQGSAKQLIAVARGETNLELKRQAIQHLSHMQDPEAMNYLMELLK